MLFVFCGLPGTGKTTVAKIIAKKLDASVISTDYIRKKMFENPTYRNWEKSLIYKMMYLLAEHLSKTETCILDAVFTKEQHRNIAKEIARRNKVPIHFVEFVCDGDVIFKRISGKRKGFSDADYQIYEKLKKEFEPMKFNHIIVDTTHGMEQAAVVLEEELKFRGIVKG